MISIIDSLSVNCELDEIDKYIILSLLQSIFFSNQKNFQKIVLSKSNEFNRNSEIFLYWQKFEFINKMFIHYFFYLYL